MKRCKLIVLAFFIMMSARAQKTIAELKPGDQVPDLVIPKIIHADKRTAKMTDFKDQLLILDFWATNCSNCIEGLPKMEHLQKQFGLKVKILPVTDEPEIAIIKFWNNNKYTKNLKLPSVVEDKILSTYFKHRYNPHEVWIYKGKVIGITAAEYVDAKNISKVLDGEEINWPVKNDYYVFDRNKPLFTPDENQIDTNNTSVKYAAISDYKEGVNSIGLSGGSGISRNVNKKTIRSYFLNQPILSSYKWLWMNIIKDDTLVKPLKSFEPNSVVWEVSNHSKYTYEPEFGYQQTWIRANGICFESLNPDTGQTDKQVYRSIISDLDGLLGLKVRWEKRKDKVLVLIRTTQEDRVKTKNSGIDPEEHIKKSGSIMRLRDCPFGDLSYQLNQQAGNPYVFDETKYEGNVDMDLNINSWTDIQGLRTSLNLYGFDLKEEEREVDKLIFTEIDGGLFTNAQIQTEMDAKKSAQKNLKNPSTEENKTFLEKNKKQQGVIVLPSGLQYKVLKEGRGAKPAANSKVSVRYTGMLVNGKIFDSSDERGKASEFTLTSVIKGWIEALKLMPEGSKWILYIPSDLAYGTHTGRGKFPPDSTMIFEIELLKILP